LTVFFRRRGTISVCELRRASALQTGSTNAQLQTGFVEQKLHESIGSQAPIELIHSENNKKASHIYLFILSLLF
jgi:hypothetical protein